MLEKWFKLKENNTTAKTEVMAGITTFMTMAYILAVNPTMLAAAGMDKTAVLIATALASFIGTMAMALLANYPFALAPGMGLNAYFAYTVCGAMGYSWQVALMAVFVEGLVFIVLSLTNVREAIFNAIPLNLKKGVSVGIGLFIAFIGLQNGGIVVANSSTLVSYVDFTSNFKTAGICALLALIGLFVIAIMYIKNVKGAILFGIVITWVFGMLCQAAGIYVPDAEAGFYSLYPALGFTDLTAIGQTFGQCFKLDFSGVHVFDFIAVVCAFLFVESSSGVAAGARTGLSSVVTGFLFLISVVLSPIFCSIPSFATAPALIFVGFLMVSTVTSIEFTDMTEAIPAYLCLLAMPLMYSISEGIAIGVISYVIINVVCGKAKKITPLMYVLAVLFVCKYIFL